MAPVSPQWWSQWWSSGSPVVVQWLYSGCHSGSTVGNAVGVDPDPYHGGSPLLDRPPAIPPCPGYPPTHHTAWHRPQHAQGHSAPFTRLLLVTVTGSKYRVVQKPPLETPQVTPLVTPPRHHWFLMTNCSKPLSNPRGFCKKCKISKNH